MTKSGRSVAQMEEEYLREIARKVVAWVDRTTCAKKIEARAEPHRFGSRFYTPCPKCWQTSYSLPIDAVPDMMATQQIVDMTLWKFISGTPLGSDACYLGTCSKCGTTWRTLTGIEARHGDLHVK